MVNESIDHNPDHETDQGPTTALRRLMSNREYMKHRGWKAPSYVSDLRKTGKIPLFIECPAGCGAVCNVTAAACGCGQPIADAIDIRKAKIDPVEADIALQAGRDPGKEHVVERHAVARGSDQAAGELPLEAGSTNKVTGLTHYKERTERARAEGLELALREKRGELGLLADMQREGHNIAKLTGDALSAIPDRLAAVLAAERNEAQVHYLLLKEINRVRDELYRKLGGGSSTDNTAAG